MTWLLSHSSNCHSLTSLCVHPSRPDTVATGSGEGVLSLWDVRYNSTPIASLQAHAHPLWDVLFLPSQPTCLLTCGEAGGIHLWDFNTERKPPSQVSFHNEDDATLKASVLFQTDLSVNCLDVD